MDMEFACCKKKSCLEGSADVKVIHPSILKDPNPPWTKSYNMTNMSFSTTPPARLVGDQMMWTISTVLRNFPAGSIVLNRLRDWAWMFQLVSWAQILDKKDRGLDPHDFWKSNVRQFARASKGHESDNWRACLPIWRLEWRTTRANPQIEIHSHCRVSNWDHKDVRRFRDDHPDCSAVWECVNECWRSQPQCVEDFRWNVTFPGGYVAWIGGQEMGGWWWFLQWGWEGGGWEGEGPVQICHEGWLLGGASRGTSMEAPKIHRCGASLWQWIVRSAPRTFGSQVSGFWSRLRVSFPRRCKGKVWNQGCFKGCCEGSPG